MIHHCHFRVAVADDVNAITSLFRNTVMTVNAVDYTAGQLRVWSSVADDSTCWINRINTQYFLLCFMNHELVGFASLDDAGCLDVLFVHENYQRHGIATQLLQKLLACAREKNIALVETDASITARPFFEKKGFRVVQEQEKELNGMVFTNYRMQKIHS